MESTSNRITAVLGPTNTGKTHLAVDTLLEYESGIIGFPLRLLAREIFDKCVNKIGAEKVALITEMPSQSNSQKSNRKRAKK